MKVLMVQVEVGGVGHFLQVSFVWTIFSCFALALVYLASPLVFLVIHSASFQMN